MTKKREGKTIHHGLQNDMRYNPGSLKQNRMTMTVGTPIHPTIIDSSLPFAVPFRTVLDLGEPVAFRLLDRECADCMENARGRGEGGCG